VSPGGADDPLSLRVTVSDSWRVVPLTLPPGSPVAELKRRALEGAAISQRHASGYEVKFGGALVADETQRLDAVGIPDGAGLVVLPRRRRPVR
jgi:hypothetical protein